MKIGCHVSIQDGLDQSFRRARDLGCETLQIFTQNQRQWRSKVYDEQTIFDFRQARTILGYERYPVIAHSSYLINLCASNQDTLSRSRRAFYEELKRSDLLGLTYLVIHPGAHGGKGLEWGINKIAESLNLTFQQYQPSLKILLETIAGQGTGVGSRFEELAAILALTENKEHVGVCLDTCHVFAAGYKIHNEREWQDCLDQLQENFSLETVCVFHLNDSRYIHGSKKDRHAAIGEGMIGMEGFEFIVNCRQFWDTPGILEVPGGETVFKSNIELLKKLRQSDHTP